MKSWMKTAVLCVTWACSPPVDAAREIRQYNQQISGSAVEIDDLAGTILITSAPANQVFKFEAFDDANPSTPANIEIIGVDEGVGGTITILIAPDPNAVPPRTYGAAGVRVIDLSNADTGQIVDVNISGDLGRTSSDGS